MISAEQVKALVDDKIKGTDLYLVDVVVDAANKIMVEIDGNEGVSIQSCVDVSRHIEQSLDREQEDFELQVSSPGLDKAFKVLDQYHKSQGKDVAVRLKEGGKLKGKLLEVSDEGIVLETSRKERIEGRKKKEIITEQLRFTFEEVAETKRVISFK